MDDSRKELVAEQVEMHRSFFDKCRFAIECGFYLEAVFLEYSALEGRLEVMLGVLGMPCNNLLDSKIRKDIKISHRLSCLERIMKASDAFKTSKLPANYFTKVKEWTDKRNRYVHGLYKDAAEYRNRMSECKELANQGIEYLELLYKDVKRIRRMNKNHPEYFDQEKMLCRSKGCGLYKIIDNQKECK